MIDQLSLQYPAWYIILCLLTAGLISGLLYYKETRFREEHAWLPYVLFALRFLTLSAIAFFLLSPLIRNVKENVQQPLIVIAQDASESVIDGMTPEEVSVYNVNLKTLEERLESKYDVRTFSFGDDVQPGLIDSFTQKVSNLSKALDYLEENFADQNLGAVIMASDGIYNEGRNPIYNIGRITAPLYGIAMGDTAIKTDLTIKGVYSNSIVYLGDRFSVQVDIKAQNSLGKTTKLSLYQDLESGRKLLKEENISINSNDFFTTKEYIIDANVAGINKYRISVSPIAGEISRSNNIKDLYVQVLDARQKILILAQAPHPDLSALSQIVTSNKNYEADIKIIGDSYNISSYDQIILHNLPGKNKNIDGDLAIIKEKRLPHLFIVGSQMDIPSFNQSQDLIAINSNGITLEEVNPIFNNAFKSFNSSEELRAKLAAFPPLVAPFGEYSLISNASSFLYQSIKNVETDYPLITFQEKGGVRSAVIVGEGIWKWRLFDFLQHGNYEIVSEVVNKTIQFISTKKDNRKFIVKPNKNLYKENESIQVTAQLYNDNYELNNEPEVSLSILDATGQEFKYTLSRNNNYYSIDVGQLPPGKYRYRARTNYNGQDLSDSGQFSVQEIQLESFDLQARHDVLLALAGENGGIYYPDAMDQLADEVLNKASIKPVIYQNVKTQPLIDLKWLFFILLAMITAEWALRRYYGSY